MGPKQILTICVFVLSIPVLIGMVVWAARMGSMSPAENAAAATALIVNEATPWWLEPVEWLAGLGTVGAIAIFALLYFAKKYGML